MPVPLSAKRAPIRKGRFKFEVSFRLIRSSFMETTNTTKSFLGCPQSWNAPPWLGSPGLPLRSRFTTVTPSRLGGVGVSSRPHVVLVCINPYSRSFSSATARIATVGGYTTSEPSASGADEAVSDVTETVSAVRSGAFGAFGGFSSVNCMSTDASINGAQGTDEEAEDDTRVFVSLRRCTTSRLMGSRVCIRGSGVMYDNGETERSGRVVAGVARVNRLLYIGGCGGDAVCDGVNRDTP